jgi:hypothetical protein
MHAPVLWHPVAPYPLPAFNAPPPFHVCLSSLHSHVPSGCRAFLASTPPTLPTTGSETSCTAWRSRWLRAGRSQRSRAQCCGESRGAGGGEARPQRQAQLPVVPPARLLGLLQAVLPPTPVAAAAGGLGLRTSARAPLPAQQDSQLQHRQRSQRLLSRVIMKLNMPPDPLPVPLYSMLSISVCLRHVPERARLRLGLPLAIAADVDFPHRSRYQPHSFIDPCHRVNGTFQTKHE